MDSKEVVLAIAAHPDDIEFTMAGTMLLLKKWGCELHYMTIANGSCGSASLGAEEIIRVRAEESRKACDILQATYHPPLCNDFEIYPTQELHHRLCAVVRKVEPTIILTQSLQDYMDDHQNTGRLAAMAAFTRGIPNFPVIPFTEEPTFQNVALYHAQPHGNRDEMNNFVTPSFIVNIDSVMEVKTKALLAHESQREFLARQQNMGSYVSAMELMCQEVANHHPYGDVDCAEGWRQHNWRGFSREGFNPLLDILGPGLCHQLDV